MELLAERKTTHIAIGNIYIGAACITIAIALYVCVCLCVCLYKDYVRKAKEYAEKSKTSCYSQ